MPVSRWNQIAPGLPVSIVLKADQRTGRQVQGTVAQLLTKHDHPRGIKVKLTDGRVGRVQQILKSTSLSTSHQSPALTHSTPASFPNRPQQRMADHNPWASVPSQGNTYGAGNTNPTSDPNRNPNIPSSNPAAGQHDEWPAYQSSTNQHQQSPPYNQTEEDAWSSQRYYGDNNNQNQYQPPTGPPPQQRPQPARRRSSTEDILAREENRGEQYEHMQQYESQARVTDDDRNQAQLQKEFPNIDSSLIAALYSDTRNLASTRELLQELNSGS